MTCGFVGKEVSGPRLILRALAQKSGEVHRETLEISERAVAEGTFVRGPQDHAGRLARLECFLPTGCTQAPTIAGAQARKAKFRHRCRKIIAARLGKLEKRGSHDGADRVTADILLASVAAAVSKEPRHGFQGAEFEPVTEDIAGCSRPTAPVSAVVSQHCRLPCRCHAHEGRPTVAGKLCAINCRDGPANVLFEIATQQEYEVDRLCGTAQSRQARCGNIAAPSAAAQTWFKLENGATHATRASPVNYRQAGCAQRHFEISSDPGERASA
jgi:hypothetical protein